MQTERRNQLILALLGVALIAVLYRTWSSTTDAPPSPSNGKAAAPAKGGPASITAPDVHLDALKAEPPKPETERNLFRFKQKAPPPPPPSELLPPPPVVPSGPPPPPPVP